MIFSAKKSSDSRILLTCVVVAKKILTCYKIKFFVSASLIVISTYSNLSITLRKSMSGCRIDDESDVLFFIAYF